MAISCLLKNFIFDNSNFTGAYIAQLVEYFCGTEEVASSTHAVGTKNNNFLLKLKIQAKYCENYLIKISC